MFTPLVGRSSLLILPLLFSGCGTISNFQPTHTPDRPVRREVFGGVREDFRALTEADGGILLPFLVVADMSFSLVGDVIALPWTVMAAGNQRLERLVDNRQR
jgi:uncharacterized protein YceK